MGCYPRRDSLLRGSCCRKVVTEEGVDNNRNLLIRFPPRVNQSSNDLVGNMVGTILCGADAQPFISATLASTPIAPLNSRCRVHAYALGALNGHRQGCKREPLIQRESSVPGVIRDRDAERSRQWAM